MKDFIKFMKKSLFTIRKKKKEDHPQIIIDANKTKFSSLPLTHSKKQGFRKNIELETNPNPKDAAKAYVSKRMVTDFKFRFSKAFKNYKLSDNDARKILVYLKNRKK